MLHDAPNPLAVPVALRFWSVEPMLGDLGTIPPSLLPDRVICGGESGRGARLTHPQWPGALHDQCEAAHVPLPFKQHGEWGPHADGPVHPRNTTFMTPAGDLHGAFVVGSMPMFRLGKIVPADSSRARSTTSFQRNPNLSGDAKASMSLAFSRIILLCGGAQRGNNACKKVTEPREKMIEQLYPCDHCSGRPTLGRSQRVVEQDGYPAFDFTAFGRFSGPPKVGDVLARPLSAPMTEKLVCIYCSGCGMSTPWEPIGADENTARDRVAKIWNQRVNRPKVIAGDIRDLIEKELGAVDAQLVIGMLARNDTDWAERGPIFAMLAQRIVDATVVTLDSWPIDPVLRDAARYRKLLQLARWVEIDGERAVQFPKVPSPREHQEMPFEDCIALAVDAMPDRNRW